MADGTWPLKASSNADGDGLSPFYLLAVVAGSVLASLVVHEGGHALAAKALGGEDLRLCMGWPAFRVEVTLPPGRELQAAFLLAGVLANLGAAGALLQTSSCEFQLAAGVQLLSVVVNLLPFRSSDGARLLALRRR